MSLRNTFRLLGFVFGAFLLLIAGAGISYLLKLERSVGVVEMHEGLKAGKPATIPSISYTRKDGRRWGHSAEDVNLKFQAGETVTILYDPTGKTSMIKTPRLWFSPVLTCGLGISIVLFSWLAFRKRAERKQTDALSR